VTSAPGLDLDGTLDSSDSFPLACHRARHTHQQSAGQSPEVAGQTHSRTEMTSRVAVAAHSKREQGGNQARSTWMRRQSNGTVRPALRSGRAAICARLLASCSTRLMSSPSVVLTRSSPSSSLRLQPDFMHFQSNTATVHVLQSQIYHSHNPSCAVVNHA
jgi:hypothetical protein